MTFVIVRPSARRPLACYDPVSRLTRGSGLKVAHQAGFEPVEIGLEAADPADADETFVALAVEQAQLVLIEKRVVDGTRDEVAPALYQSVELEVGLVGVLDQQAQGETGTATPFQHRELHVE